MKGAFIILLALVVTGAVLYLFHRRDVRRGTAQAPSIGPMPDRVQDEDGDDTACCGMHVTCEKDSLLASVSAEIEYFDDEELDVFAGRPAESYTAVETEQFRDVLLTLLPSDIAPWARSIQLRGIELPPDVRDELLMIVAEARDRLNVG
ncbi:MAG: phospholipase [Bacteroidales bacterium]|nr:phospholipase [Bacteroidales bacterium]